MPGNKVWWDPDNEVLRYTNEPTNFQPSSIYLHINGTLIFKHRGYEYSPGCMWQDGGMVSHIWRAPFNIEWFRMNALDAGASEQAIESLFAHMGWTISERY